MAAVTPPGSSKGGLPKPVVNAMLVCDEAERESKTGKITVKGIFETILAKGFPAKHPFLCVYVKLIDAHGTYPIRFSVLHLETGRLIGTGESEMVAADRMRPIELMFNLRNFIFPDPGTYEFQIHADGRYIGSKTVNLVLSSSR